jgi:cell division protein FtsW (lipid II flippase)
MARRTKLGLLALLFFALAGVLWLLESSNPLAREGWAVCLRVGIILGVFWLAYPDLVRLPVWLLPAIVVIVLAAIRWKIFLFAIPPAIFLGWLLRPRNKHPVR